MAQATRTATIRFAVPFCDVDAIQMVWHGNYFKYFDVARDRLYCDAGIDMCRVAQDHGVIFPITRTQTKHVHPLRFRDEVECKATLVEDACRLIVEFELRLADGGRVCAKGRTEQAAVRIADSSLELRLPEFIRRALAPVRDDG